MNTQTEITEEIIEIMGRQADTANMLAGIPERAPQRLAMMFGEVFKENGAYKPVLNAIFDVNSLNVLRDEWPRCFAALWTWLKPYRSEEDAHWHINDDVAKRLIKLKGELTDGKQTQSDDEAEIFAL